MEPSLHLKQGLTLLEKVLKFYPMMQEGDRAEVCLTQQDWLVLEVRDDGQASTTQPPHNSNGIGLTNTRARLRALYGDEHSFALTRTDADDGTVARVKLPIRMLEQAA